MPDSSYTLEPVEEEGQSHTTVTTRVYMYKHIHTHTHTQTLGMKQMFNIQWLTHGKL